MLTFHPARAIALTPWLALAILLGACGTQLGFTAADGALTYKRLPKTGVVEVIEGEAAIDGPYELLGTLDVTVDPAGSSGTAEAVKTRFEKSAAKNGCDRVVGMAKVDVAVASTRREKVEGDHGKVRYEKVPITVTHHRWTARCVRTSAAPGGLQGEPTPAPVPPASAPQPQPIPVPPPTGSSSTAPAPAP
jgi:hypothetical protein